jgi:hypothetical protein
MRREISMETLGNTVTKCFERAKPKLSNALVASRRDVRFESRNSTHWMRCLGVLGVAICIGFLGFPEARVPSPQASPIPIRVIQASPPDWPIWHRLLPPPATPCGGSEWDPLSLIGDVSTIRRYSTGEDLWEVWVCDLPHGHADIDAATAAQVLNEELKPFFAWLSEERYEPRFLAAGAAVSTPGEDYPCQVRVEGRRGGDANGGMVITDELNTPDTFTYVDDEPAPSASVFPDNGRIIRAGAHVVLRDAWNFDPKRIAHELGHAIGWPHSYQDSGAGGCEYNNPVDVMSGDLSRGGDLKVMPQGTLAINRYAAGWINPAQVGIHTVDGAEYSLGPIGTHGLQLVVLPTIAQGRFTTLDVRVSSGYDTGIQKEGVTVHTVDQSSGACSHPAQGGCFGHMRRTSPLVGDQEIALAYNHVLGPGDSLLVGLNQIRVLERVGDRFRVQIASVPDTDRAHLTSLAAQPV